jgi:GxxExxY protein
MQGAEGDPLTFAIIGAAMDVHSQLGCGFLEPVYQEALALELTMREIPFRPQTELRIVYKGHRLAAFYNADFRCYDSVIVELKALGQIGDLEQAQVLNYLKASGIRTGLLLNFGARSLQHKRFVYG